MTMREPVCAAQCVGSDRTVAVRVGPVGLDEARWWQWNIQPVISADTKRLDRDWDWVEIGSTTLFLVRQRRQLLAATVQLEGRDPVIGALMLLVEYPWLFEPGHPSMFVWYLAAAPQAALKQHLPPECVPRGLGRILMDAAVLSSIDLGYKGRVWLHAHPDGEEQLFALYENGYKMRNVPATLPFRLPSPRSNDGRYFYYDEGDVEPVLKAHDRLRVLGRT